MQTREKKINALRRKYNFSELGLYFALYKRYTGLEIEKNIRYATDGKRTYLDIVHEKNGGNEKHPLFIYLHGGGWVSAFIIVTVGRNRAMYAPISAMIMRTMQSTRSIFVRFSKA